MRLPRRPRVPAPRRLRRHPLRRALAPLLLVLLLITVAVWWWQQVGHEPDAAETSTLRDARLDELQAALAELADERDAAVRERLRGERRADVAEAELAACRREAEAREAELLALRDELAFYQRLADDAGGDRVGLRNVAVHETGLADEYELLFQIYRSGLRGEFPLSWTLELEGYEDDNAVTLEAADLGLEDADEREFALRFLRTVQVRLVLPEGFSPERLSFTVDPDEDGPDRIEKTTGWAAARRASE
ncbi:DUF6776 family protein [Thioalkalivibrio sp. ALJ24]|uniref:DUF6776 family protein n=1 Tax=Thioalkalivibrio sp. ALJ24 TaxID=545276 RepID=UPI00035E90A0|nr:DUF6776 family protein [Thioalkalivibrio sp. ALJ24]